jgi:hypothetical protein
MTFVDVRPMGGHMWRVVILALMTLSVASCGPVYRFQHPATGVVFSDCNYLPPYKQEICVNSWLNSGYIRVP